MYIYIYIYVYREYTERERERDIETVKILQELASALEAPASGRPTRAARVRSVVLVFTLALALLLLLSLLLHLLLLLLLVVALLGPRRPSARLRSQRWSGISRIRFLSSSNQIPCSSNVCLHRLKLFSDSSNRGMSKQCPLTVFLESPRWRA